MGNEASTPNDPDKANQHNHKKDFHDARACGNRLSPQLWVQLLSSLHLIECFRLESVCRTFSTAVYAKQRRFVWNKKYKKYLKDTYGFAVNDEAFILALFKLIAEKIGSQCHQLRLKLSRLTDEHVTVISKFTKLEQFWLQMSEVSDAFQRLCADDKIAANCREIRFMLMSIDDARQQQQNGKEYGWMPKEFGNRLATKFLLLQTLSLWRSEPKFVNEILSRKHHLHHFAIYCDDHALSFFDKFCKNYGEQPNFRCLTLKWQVEQLNEKENFLPVLSALGKLIKIKCLQLEVCWNSVSPKKEVSDALGGESLLKMWCSYMRTRIAKCVRRLSLECTVGMSDPKVTATAMLHAFSFAFHLKLLRIAVTSVENFPLYLDAKSVETLIIDFKYATDNIRRPQNKNKNGYGNDDNKQKLENNDNNESIDDALLPRIKSTKIYLFSAFRGHRSTRTLRLLQCVVPLNLELLEHIAYWFPELEQFQFQALHLPATKANIYPHDLDKILANWIEKMSRLRVIDLDDTTLPERIGALPKSLLCMLARAKRNPKLAFKFVCGVTPRLCKHPDRDLIMRYLHDTSNLRIY